MLYRLNIFLGKPAHYFSLTYFHIDLFPNRYIDLFPNRYIALLLSVFTKLRRSIFTRQPVVATILCVVVLCDCVERVSKSASSNLHLLPFLFPTRHALLPGRYTSSLPDVIYLPLLSNNYLLYLLLHHLRSQPTPTPPQPATMFKALLVASSNVSVTGSRYEVHLCGFPVSTTSVEVVHSKPPSLCVCAGKITCSSQCSCSNSCVPVYIMSSYR